MMKPFAAALKNSLALAVVLTLVGLHIKRPKAPHIPHVTRKKGGSGADAHTTKRKGGATRTPVHPPLSRAVKTARTRATTKGRPKPRGGGPAKPPAAKPKTPASTKPPRNHQLAGKKHPVTGVPFDKDGYPDFSQYRHPQVPDVRIELTGTRGGDERAANAKAGLSGTPKGYTWHHHQDTGLMQLVKRTVHDKTGHTGGFSRGPKH